MITNDKCDREDCVAELSGEHCYDIVPVEPGYTDHEIAFYAGPVEKEGNLSDVVSCDRFLKTLFDEAFESQYGVSVNIGAAENYHIIETGDNDRSFMEKIIADKLVAAGFKLFTNDYC